MQQTLEAARRTAETRAPPAHGFRLRSRRDRMTRCCRRRSSARSATAHALARRRDRASSRGHRPTARSPKARSPPSPWRCSSAAWTRAERVALTRAMTRFGHRARLAGRRPRPGPRQAFDRRRRRQGQPDARAAGRRLRRLRADDLRPRPRPHRRHARQARRHSRLSHATPDIATVPRGRARGRLRRSSARPTTSRPPTAGSTRSAT